MFNLKNIFKSNKTKSNIQSVIFTVALGVVAYNTLKIESTNDYDNSFNQASIEIELEDFVNELSDDGHNNIMDNSNKRTQPEVELKKDIDNPFSIHFRTKQQQEEEKQTEQKRKVGKQYAEMVKAQGGVRTLPRGTGERLQQNR